MTIPEQERAFERELHSLCTRFLDEWDLPMVAMITLLEAEQFVIISLISDKVDQEDMDGDDSGDWGAIGDDGPNGEEYE